MQLATWTGGPERLAWEQRAKKCKLTPADVEAIRASKASNIELAEKYGIHRNRVAAIRRKVGWRWVNQKDI